MEILQGTTPTLTFKVKNDIDLNTITVLWIYITQQNKEKVLKELSDVTIDNENKTISVTLTQQDTLACKAQVETILQIRALAGADTALETKGTKITILPAYKGGVIGG